MSRYNRPIMREEQMIYDHLLHWIEQESPTEMIARFQTLFINGVGYPDHEISQALKKIVGSDLATEDFRYILNRCCHILINRWQTRPQSQLAIPQLVKLFETPPQAFGISATHSHSVKRLHSLTSQFTETEQYLTLRRLAQVLTEAAESQGNRSLGTLIRRYPYLYEHCLLSDESTHEQQVTVQKIQLIRQKQFEIDLSQYVTYQVRRSHSTQCPNPANPQRIIVPVTNPTLLSEQDLSQALRHYVGKVEGSRTHKDIALNFMTHVGASPSIRSFKDDLYQYITASVDPAYGNRKFNNQLYYYLQGVLPDSSHQRLNDFWLIRICNHLLNFLVADKPQSPNHFMFIDLITNLGPIATIAILLKIVLICRKVRPCLERRLSILFSHYEMSTREAVEWLVQALETLNVALTTNFGSMNLALIH
ncbi:MAG: hypothetical protein HY785_14365 [Oscillatoriophycideae cyanobacterium NC_groundwater_1537_Pr4_S-0.65um_50_18]|nr:hypothetical protein [Oscillatoriophycideae cyanobacterium NC_groundwater_1537_Pr4_S-0.65um_50_18]